MRVPHVSDRIKEAPAAALRGMLAGVGQLLLVTDKLRNKTPAADNVPQARTPGTTESAPEPASSPPEAARAPQAATPPEAAPPPPADTGPQAEPTAPRQRDLDKTGNVRLLPGADTEARHTEAGQAPAAAGIEAPAGPETPAGTATSADAEATAEAGAAAQVPASESDALPLPNYDELSVPSLRARLRNLTAAQVTVLVEYEKAHAARPEVVTMFERRIAKLATGG